MGKDKIRKFKENETFRCLIQPPMDEVLHKDHPLKGHWGAEVFGNDHPIILELGCGKGEYTIALAERFPQNNYIGVDIKGARLWKGAKYATEHALPNVAFLRTRIDFIDSLFGPGEVSEIWLTFSDPQPKKPNKRLSSPIFLERYSPRGHPRRRPHPAAGRQRHLRHRPRREGAAAVHQNLLRVDVPRRRQADYIRKVETITTDKTERTFFRGHLKYSLYFSIIFAVLNNADILSILLDHATDGIGYIYIKDCHHFLASENPEEGESGNFQYNFHIITNIK